MVRQLNQQLTDIFLNFWEKQLRSDWCRGVFPPVSLSDETNDGEGLKHDSGLNLFLFCYASIKKMTYTSTTTSHKHTCLPCKRNYFLWDVLTHARTRTCSDTGSGGMSLTWFFRKGICVFLNKMFCWGVSHQPALTVTKHPVQLRQQHQAFPELITWQTH